MAHNFLLQLACLLAVLGCVIADEPERIVSGKDASVGEFPYMVSLRDGGLHYCGGAIISPYHILTAAHCVDSLRRYPYDYLTVVTGSISIKDGGESYQVSKIFVHPQFDPTKQGFNWVNDAAVIKVEKPIKFDKVTQMIKLPSQEPPSNVVGDVSGWGYTELKLGATYNTILQKLRVKVINRTECQKKHTIKLTENNICTLPQRFKGICHGDSGSPLVYNNEVIGIVSASIPCAIGYPDVFTKVYGTLEFINQSMAF